MCLVRNRSGSSSKSWEWIFQLPRPHCEKMKLPWALLLLPLAFGTLLDTVCLGGPSFPKLASDARLFEHSIISIPIGMTMPDY